MIHAAHAGALLLLIAGYSQSAPVPGWQRATEIEPSRVPYTPSPVNEVIAAGDGGWRFNGTRVDEGRLLQLAREATHLAPEPVLLVDFSKVHVPSEKRRLMIAIADAAGCAREYPACIEGTRGEYDRF